MLGNDHESEAPPSCVFCDNESGSEEHLWAAWIHRHKNFGPLRVQEGTGPEVIDPNPEQTINTVCHTCNNTWMSRLEEKNKPAILAMMDNTPFTIDPGRQRLLREWAVKTAMISDSIKPRNASENFYTREERVKMLESRAIPDRTRIWIGQLSESHLGMFGTDYTILADGKTQVGEGTANTIIVGHLVVQVVTEHIRPEFAHLKITQIQPRPGDWDQKLIEIWPTTHKKVNWPPPKSFTNGGPDGMAYLMHRWRMGERVGAISADKVQPIPGGKSQRFLKST